MPGESPIPLGIPGDIPGIPAGIPGNAGAGATSFCKMVPLVNSEVGGRMGLRLVSILFIISGRRALVLKAQASAHSAKRCFCSSEVDGD